MRRLEEAASAFLVLFGLVFELASKHRTCYGTDDAVAAHFVAAKVSSSTTTQGAHQTPVTFSLCVWVCRAVVLLTRLAIGMLALSLRILILGISALLWELVARLSTRILTLLTIWAAGMLAMGVTRRKECGRLHTLAAVGHRELLGHAGSHREQVRHIAGCSPVARRRSSPGLWVAVVRSLVVDNRSGHIHPVEDTVAVVGIVGCVGCTDRKGQTL